MKGPDGGYRLGAGADLPPLLFDDEQAVALAIALQIAATTPGSTTGEAAARALHTVRQVMPSRLRHQIDTVRVTAADRPAEQPAPDVLVAISAAIHARAVFRFDYGDHVRRTEPHHLVTRGGRWYLIAWDCGQVRRRLRGGRPGRADRGGAPAR
jgi:predicted DNA-binding transcriptional regulator YafY